MTYSLRSLASAVVCALLVVACGGAEPQVQTQAQVISTTTWSGTFGELGEIAGSGNSAVLDIGKDRQCAVVRKLGAGSFTVRVANNSDSIESGVIGASRTVCGEGPLR